MPTSRQNARQTEQLLRYIQETLESALHFSDEEGDLDAQVQMVGLARAAAPGGPAASPEIDRYLLERIRRQEVGLRDAQALQSRLSEMVGKITSPPWHLARLIQTFDDGSERKALVQSGPSLDVVAIHSDLRNQVLMRGEIVYLSSERNCVLRRAGGVGGGGGETVSVERVLPDGRLLVNSRGEEMVVEVADDCDPAALKRGAQVRLDRNAWMVIEVLERESGRQYFAEDVDMSMTRSLLGGQRRALDRLFQVLLSTLSNPEVAKLYGVRRRRSVLLYGPPGNGKTMMARICAAELRRITGRRCVFAVVRPGEWLNSYVGETERAIRDTFTALREAIGTDGMAVLFIDEIETIGAHRGRAGNHHHDRFLGTLLAEIDGFRDRGEIAIIAATNRKDMLDAALADRLCSIDIEVKRPDLRGAREIFGVHLPEQLRFHANGKAPMETREAMIDRAATRLYASNGDNEICNIHFRSGAKQTVTARDLVSGRMISQICETACDRALERHIAGGGEGLRLEDIDHAVDESLERMGSMITLTSARAYLTTLPNDIDMVRVEPAARKVKSSIRYAKATPFLSTAAASRRELEGPAPRTGSATPGTAGMNGSAGMIE
jgi:ATP-dependent 26S proteasome regulatory subunit